MSVLLLKFAPWIAAVLVVFGAGTWTGNKLNPWHGRYTSLQAADTQERLKGEEAVRKALQAQLDAAHATSTNNAKVIHDLQTQNAAVSADRDHTNDLVRRLLAHAARPSPAGGPVPETSDQPRTAPAGRQTGDAGLANLLGDAHDECERNSNRLDALIAQVKAQI